MKILNINKKSVKYIVPTAYVATNKSVYVPDCT